MIIKIIPETDIEKQSMQKVEHTGVKEFLIFGSKQDKEDGLSDFHDWKGSYRYLEGSLYHFLTTITEEKKSKKGMQQRSNNEIDLIPPAQSRIKSPFIKQGQAVGSDIKIIDTEPLKDESVQKVIEADFSKE